MSTEDHVLAALVIVVLVIAGQLLSRRLRIPAAIVLVLLGLGVGFLPRMTAALSLTPEMVLLLFLPPLIYNAAFFSSPRDIRLNARPIIGLAVGMTLLVAFAIAAVAYWVLPGVTWPMAIAFGAAVAPTDAVSASAVLKRVGAPRQVVTVLEGESLINDGVALTLFSLAVTAMVTPLTVTDGVVELLRVVLGGLVYGVAFALLVARFRSLFRDSSTQLVVSLLIPFAAFIPAYLVGFSGVLATVVAGFYLGTRGEGLLPPRVRVTGRTIWKGLVSLLESSLFVLLGLQLHTVLETQTGYAASEVIWAAVAVTIVTILLRLVWEALIPPLGRHLPGRLYYDPGSFRHRLVIGWSGMRGAISLAIAMSLPFTLDGEEYPERPILILLAGVVVLITLVGQGTTLTPLLRGLGLVAEDNTRYELALAHERMHTAAVTVIDELIAEGTVDEATAEAPRRMHLHQAENARLLLENTRPEDAAETHAKFVHLKREAIQAERDAIGLLYRDGAISHDSYQLLIQELDLREPPPSAR